jgi:hypothetical protein
MTTADEVVGRAVALAEENSDMERAVRELLECCGGRRVSVVIARQRLKGDVKESPDDQVKTRAVQLLDLVLERGSWDLA